MTVGLAAVDNHEGLQYHSYADSEEGEYREELVSLG
jgi:hypothetical protein